MPQCLLPGGNYTPDQLYKNLSAHSFILTSDLAANTSIFRVCAVQCIPVIGTVHKSVLGSSAPHIIQNNCTTSSSKVSIEVCCSICLKYSKSVYCSVKSYKVVAMTCGFFSKHQQDFITLGWIYSHAIWTKHPIDPLIKKIFRISVIHNRVTLLCHMITLHGSLTVSGKSQLFTDYTSISVPPKVITHGAPGITPAHLHTSLTSSDSTTKPHCTLSTTCAVS